MLGVQNAVTFPELYGQSKPTAAVLAVDIVEKVPDAVDGECQRGVPRQGTRSRMTDRDFSLHALFPALTGGKSKYRGSQTGIYIVSDSCRAREISRKKKSFEIFVDKRSRASSGPA